MSKSGSQIVGYKYHLGAHMALCYPVDELQEIKVGDRTAWSGNVSTGQITVDAPDLFGGQEREGGVAGDVDVLMGEADQPINDYLSGLLGSVIPAFRRVFSLVFRQFYWGNNPYIKNPAFKVKRTDIHTDHTTMWYLAKANINSGDLNAAHIIRECLASYDWGMGYPAAMIDDASFTASADQLYSEGFGLSLKWSRAEPIEAFIQRINDHVDAVIDVSPETGLIEMRLIRGDYDAGTLPLIDESNSELQEFERRGWGETVNQVTVVYRDRETNRDIPVTVQDIGNIQIQGGVVAETHQYPGIPNGDLASRVALRDLRAKSAPLSRLKIRANRAAYALRRGDVFRYSNSRYGLDQVVYRIADIDRGDLQDGRITIDAVEDVFALGSNSLVSPQASGWTSPNTAPAPALAEQVIEASYWDVTNNVSAADVAQLDPDFGFLVTHAARASGDSYNYQIHTKVGAAAYAQTGTGYFCPTATLDGALGVDGAELTDKVVSITGGVDLQLVEPDTIAYIGTECVAIRAIDTGADTITIDRGILDTVPVDHADGKRIWFVDGFQGFDRTERVDAEVVDAKLLPVTSQGALDIASAAALQLILDNRYQRPYPPGNLQINAARYPATIGGTALLAATWAHRDRALQTAYLVDQTEGDIGPEAGQTYTMRIYGEEDTLGHTESGITAALYTYDSEKNDFGIPDTGEEPLVATVQMSFEQASPLNEAPGGSSMLGFNSFYREASSPKYGAYRGNFDATNAAVIAQDYVTGHLGVGASTDKGAVDFTLDTFVYRPSGAGTNKPIANKGGPGWGATGRTTNDKQGWDLYDKDGYLAFRAGSISIDGWPGFFNNRSTTLLPSDDAWHHVRVSCTNNVLVMTVDGITQTQVKITDGSADDLSTCRMYCPTMPLVVGSDKGLETDGTRFAGNAWQSYPLDNFRIIESAALNTGDHAVPTDLSLPTVYRLNGRLRVEIESERDGYTSAQLHNLEVRRPGWNFNWDMYFDGGT